MYKKADTWTGLKEGMEEVYSLIGPPLTLIPPDPDTLTGRVIKFSADRNFGFIKNRDHGDVFFHLDNSPDIDPTVLSKGTPVTFILSEDRGGRMCGINVREA